MSSMAAAEGSTWEGSAPKIQAVSMHRAGRTRLPPASREYLMASSSPPSRASLVNLRPWRYSSKARLCPSHLSWPRVPLAPLAMLHPAVRLYFSPPQDSPHKRRRLLAGETPGELDGLVHRDLRGDVVHVEHLVEREAQDRTVHSAHAVHRPPYRDFGEQCVDLFLFLLDAAGELDRVLLEVPPVLAPALHGRAERMIVYVALVQGQERLPAGRPAAQGPLQSTARQTLVRYSLERVSTLTWSPTLTKSGTCTTTPVSRVAGLVPPVAVSPLRPGSVSETPRSTWAGGSTLTTSPSAESTETVPPSTMYHAASPTTPVGTGT